MPSSRSSFVWADVRQDGEGPRATPARKRGVWWSRHGGAVFSALGTTVVVLVVDDSILLDDPQRKYSSIALTFLLALLFWEFVALLTRALLGNWRT